MSKHFILEKNLRAGILWQCAFWNFYGFPLNSCHQMQGTLYTIQCTMTLSGCKNLVIRCFIDMLQVSHKIFTRQYPTNFFGFLPTQKCQRYTTIILGFSSSYLSTSALIEPFIALKSNINPGSANNKS